MKNAEPTGRNGSEEADSDGGDLPGRDLVGQRPMLDLGEASEPVEAFVAGLQAALATADADEFNDSFAQDVVWGSPFGAVVSGYNDIHAIHSVMIPAQTGGSRYDIEHARRVNEEVAFAYVRRVSVDPHSDEAPGRSDSFDELALFVLVRRENRWWLAAGLHTPDRRDVYRT
jgi:uncharacterized protein (TIGR02246 family)